MSVKVGQSVVITANTLNARNAPNGKVVAKRPKGFGFKVTELSKDGKWAKATQNWYATQYLAAKGSSGIKEDKRLRSPKQSVAVARRWKTCRVGMCLSTVQDWLGGLHGIPWAEAAWNASKQKHRKDYNAPAGVPVYWHNPRSKYGHIALSVGGGRCRSTDWPSRARVGEGSIKEISRRWGLQYLGWAGDMPPAGDIPGVKN